MEAVKEIVEGANARAFTALLLGKPTEEAKKTATSELWDPFVNGGLSKKEHEKERAEESERRPWVRAAGVFCVTGKKNLFGRCEVKVPQNEGSVLVLS